MISTTQVWENVLIEIQARVTAFAYESWIEGLVPVCIYEDNVVLLCENSAKKRVVEERYIDVISESCKKVMPHNEGVLFILEEEREKYEKYANADIGEINSENIIVEETTCSFSPKCTFDNFIVGKSNEFAAAASKAVAQNPGTKYNPLFIYGGVGLGKTHLLNAIGNHIRKTNPKLRCMNISCERFTNELIEALRGNKHTDEMKEFRKRYRSVDVLMIDDIQFMANKSETQQELFHTFNSLYNQNKQIIFTSDRPPKELNGIEQRLISRFEQGLLADIAPPEYETRIAIIKRKAELYGMNLSDSIVDFLADKLKTNIRQLEGAITKINALTLVTGSTPTLNMAQQVVRDIQSNHEPIPLTVEKIIAEVGKIYSVTPEDMRSQKRSSQISTARQVAIYVVNRITGLSYSNIGVEFGNRDHSTIVYAINKVKSSIKKDPSFKGMIDDMIKNLGNNS